MTDQNESIDQQPQASEVDDRGNAPDATTDPDDQDRVERLAGELRSVMESMPDSTMVLFSAPVPDPDAMDARERTALAIAERAGLKPWPEWAAVRHGVGSGAHMLNIIDELGETGRAEGVVVCLLAPIEPALLTQAGAVALDTGLLIAVMGDNVPQ